MCKNDPLAVLFGSKDNSTTLSTQSGLCVRVCVYTHTHTHTNTNSTQYRTADRAKA